jgi:hypothetical protein
MVQLILPGSTATADRVLRPTGLPQIPGRTCSDANDAVSLYLKVAVFAAPTPLAQTSNFTGAGRLAARELPPMRRAKGAFLAAGYPTTFPVVRDIDREIAALIRLMAIAKDGDLKALPPVYSDLVSARDQFAHDATDDICN